MNERFCWAEIRRQTQQLRDPTGDSCGTWLDRIPLTPRREKICTYGFSASSRILAFVLAIVLLLGGAHAAEIAITCPADGSALELKLKLDGEQLNVTDTNGTASVPAHIDTDPSGMFAISASGPVEAVMPSLGALDTCIAEKLKAQGMTASDRDVVIFSANQCRLELASSSTKQRVTGNFTVTSMDKGQASLLISHQYTMPSAVTGEPMQLDEWPMRNCEVAQ